MEEKALDKNFKKEFADAEHLYSKLLQLYRVRVNSADKDAGVGLDLKFLKVGINFISTRPSPGIIPVCLMLKEQLMGCSVRVNWLCTSRSNDTTNMLTVGWPPSCLNVQRRHPLLSPSPLTPPGPKSWPPNLHIFFASHHHMHILDAKHRPLFLTHPICRPSPQVLSATAGDDQGHGV